MKTSVLSHSCNLESCRLTTNFDHPLREEGYHHLDWRFADLSALYKLGSIILLFPFLSRSTITLSYPSASCHSSRLRAMETRASGKRSSPHSPVDPPGRRPSKDLKRAADSARAFKNCLPPNVQHEVEEEETRVWQKVEEAKFDGELDEYKQWVKDPGYTTGRLALYDRALAYYWAAKHLCGLLLSKKSAKEEAEHEPIKMWRPHYRETHMIHIKLDAIANKLGMPFLPKDTAANLMQTDKQSKECEDSTPAAKAD